MNALRYSPNGEMFVSGGADGKVSGAFGRHFYVRYNKYNVLQKNIDVS